MNDYGRVAVLTGGCSAEREISLRSGRAVFEALQRNGVNSALVDFRGGDLMASLNGFDRAFIAMHGRGGEDGSLQGALQLAGVPYTGSGVLASALAMNKVMAKRLWAASGLATPKFVTVRDEKDVEQLVCRFPFPMMVKPNREGSSVGMAKVGSVIELREAIVAALEYDDCVFVEQYIEGDELTCAIVDGEALPLIQIETPRDYYDYIAKYHSDETRYSRPEAMTEAEESAIQKLCLDAFDALACAGWGRVDLMLDAQRRPWLIEMNTVPGMTDHSLVPKAAAAAGLSFDGLVLNILDTSLTDRDKPPIEQQLRKGNSHG